MADTTFPSFIKFLTWDEQPGANPVLRSPMESGLPKQRKRFTRQLMNMSVSILMNDTQYTDFIDWYNTDGGHGAVWFDITHPRTDATVEGRMVGGSFTASHFTRKQNHYILSFTLEVWF